MATNVRKIVLPVIAAAALAGGGYAGYGWWTEGRFIESTDNAYVQSDITIVSPKVSAYVREVRVAENQQVRAGDVLALLDDRDFRAKVAESEAAVTAQRAALGTLDSKLELQRAIIDQAAATLASAEAEQRRAQQDYDRNRSLASDSWTSRQKLETSDADLRKAVAQVAKSRAALAAENDQVAVLRATRTETEARLAQAQAVLETDRNDLNNTVIRAAVDGVVGNRGVQVGQYARPGVQLLALVPLPDVYVVANFKETQIGRMRPGQSVTVSVDAFPGQKLEGKVESFAPASGSKFSLLPPENATGNFTKIVQRVPVRIALPRDGALAGLLRPGLSVEAEVDTRGADSRPHVEAGGVFGALNAKQAVAAK
ncbi:HlyD family secretion protein [Azospirillum agricola]|uniref:HlyD family secretion protein n=1 Tax=Azospirillum agricola TaxID=1720247 RepID=UPI000A0EEB6A|nr:HlyD family secretion protein [Azospirillum agricola]SMH44945.1 membrane fusion protein, multidrug efflux system [Azospirillum lipoferum]